jgi:hypothetical protein
MYNRIFGDPIETDRLLYIAVSMIIIIIIIMMIM